MARNPHTEGWLYALFYAILFSDFIYLFLERGEGRERGTETSIYERNINQLPLAFPQLGTEPITLACALTGNPTSDLLVYRLALNPLNHTSLSSMPFYIRDLTTCRFWYPPGSWNQSSTDTERQWKFCGSQKLYVKFWLCRGLLSLTPVLFKGQL